MQWHKARYGHDTRHRFQFKIDRDNIMPLKAYATDQDVSVSDVINTIINNHAPLHKYKRASKDTHDTTEDDNSNEPTR